MKRGLKNYARNFAAGLALGVLSILPGCTTFGKYTVSKMETTSDTGRIYNGSEEDAIKRMMDLASISDREDAWIEIQTSNGDTYFVDVGEPRKTEDYRFKNGRMVVTSSTEAIDNALSGIPKGSNIRFYHIHPIKGWEGTNYSNFDVLGFPSQEDFDSDIIFGAEIVIRNYTSLPSRVVGPMGFSDYRASGNGMLIEDVIMEFNGNRYYSAEKVKNAIDKIHLSYFFAACIEQDPSSILESLREQGLDITYTKLRNRPNR